jgi:hypothetical protein
VLQGFFPSGALGNAAGHPNDGATTKPRLTHSYVLGEFVPLAQARKLPRQGALDFSESID